MQFLLKHKIWIIALIALVSFVLATLHLWRSKQNNPILFTKENLQQTAWTQTFGIDISHYQGVINWDKLNESQHPIKFIIIRATMGKNGKDLMFKANWQKSKHHGYIRGAYHYYRPHENSTKQFNNYKSTVKLQKGDFIPIIDIEKESIHGRDNLRRGVKNWLALAEKEYGVKPMIYTGLNFYQHVLDGYVDGYPLWIASYTGRQRINEVDWTIHQFSEKIEINGINGGVDGNNFNGEIEDLNQLLK